MAMNKREKALLLTLRVRAALRWSDAEVSKDVPVPTYGSTARLVVAWSCFPARVVQDAVERSWSEQNTHGAGNGPDESRGYRIGGRQRGIEQYSTKLRALRALRRAVEEKAAKDLYEVDLLIAAELEENPCCA